MNADSSALIDLLEPFLVGNIIADEDRNPVAIGGAGKKSGNGRSLANGLRKHLDDLFAVKQAQAALQTANRLDGHLTRLQGIELAAPIMEGDGMRLQFNHQQRRRGGKPDKPFRSQGDVLGGVGEDRELSRNAHFGAMAARCVKRRISKKTIQRSQTAPTNQSQGAIQGRRQFLQ